MIDAAWLDQHRIVEHQQLRVEEIDVIRAAESAIRLLICSICSRERVRASSAVRARAGPAPEGRGIAARACA